jgi:hypothetical protein
LVAFAQSDPGWGIEYSDETWFVWVPPQGIMNPEAGSGWAPSGHPPRNRSAREKGKVTTSAYLGLDIKENRIGWRYSSHTNRWETIEYLKERLAAHASRGRRRLLLIWDSASWHKARDVRDWIRAHNKKARAEGCGVILSPILTPVHAFWLNPVEAVIGHTKTEALPCRQFSAIEDQMASIDRYWLQRNLRRACVPTVETLIRHLH